MWETLILPRYKLTLLIEPLFVLILQRPLNINLRLDVTITSGLFDDGHAQNEQPTIIRILIRKAINSTRPS